MICSNPSNNNNGKPRENNLTVCRIFSFMSLLVRLTGENAILSFAVRKTVIQIKNAIQAESEPHRSISLPTVSVFPAIHPAYCLRNGVLNFLNKIWLFFGGFLPFLCGGHPFSKSFVFLYALIRGFYILNQVAHLTVQEGTEGVNGFPRDQFTVSDLLKV